MRHDDVNPGGSRHTAFGPVATNHATLGGFRGIVIQRLILKLQLVLNEDLIVTANIDNALLD